MATQTSTQQILIQALTGSSVSRINGVRSAMDQFRTATRRARMGAIGMTTSLTGAGLSMAAAGLAVRGVIRTYADYTQAQSRLRTTLRSTNVPAERLAGSYTAMQVASEGAGRQLGYTATESSDAMNAMLQSGRDVPEAIALIGTSMALARSGEMDFEATTRFLNATINQFGREAETTGETLQQFSRRASSALLVAANISATDLPMLEQSMRYAAPTMAAIGFSMNETIAATAALSTLGIAGSQAGTQLRAAMLALHKPSAVTADLFREVGIDLEHTNVFYDQATERLLPFQEGMNNLREVFRRFDTDLQRNRALTQMFGARSTTGGTMLAHLNQAGSDVDRIMEALGGPRVTEGTILDEAMAERMRSFGMQVQRAKVGLQELAIAVGEIWFGTEGANQFGSQISDFAAAVRLAATPVADMTADQRRQWEAIGPGIRDSAREFRSFMGDLRDFAVRVGPILRDVLGFISDNPRLVAGILLFQSTIGMGGLAGTIVSLFGSGGAAAVALAGFPALLLGLQLAFVATMGVAVLAAANSISSYAVGLQGANAELARISETRNPVEAWIRSIPILGTAIGNMIDSMRLANVLWEAGNDITARRSQAFQEQVNVSARDYTNNRVSRQLRSSGRTEGSLGMAERNAMRDRAAGQGMQASTIRTAAILASARVTSREGIAGSLRSGGIAEDEIQVLTAEVRHFQQDASLMSMTARELNVDWTNASSAIGITVDQLAQFSRILANIRVGTDPAPVDVQSVQDANVRRGGLIRVASGDLIMSRQHLASAVGYSRGSLADQATGNSSRLVSPPSTPTASTQSGGGDIVIQIDGREIARAVGRQHESHLNRSGANVAPGTRTTLRNTGFPERSGQ